MKAQTTGERRSTAAAAHLGVPFLGPLLPLVFVLTATNQSFVRRHARQALAFQVAYFTVYVGLVMAAIPFDAIPIWVLPASWAIAAVLEVPQIALALAGRGPIRLVPG